MTISKILVIDDSLLIQKMLKMSLEKHYGCDVLYADDGQQGFQKLMRNPDTNIVFCDLNMPVIDGIKFISFAKSVKDLKHIPIVVISAAEGESDAARAVQLGAAAYLKKPFQFKDVHYIIESLGRAAVPA